MKYEKVTCYRCGLAHPRDISHESERDCLLALVAANHLIAEIFSQMIGDMKDRLKGGDS